MSLENFAIWLSESPLSIALTDFEIAFPAIESLHVIALTLVVGSIALVDLHLLGLAWRRRDASDLMRSILPITWLAFAFALLTGLLLFAANPISYSANFYFLAKLSLLVLAGVNMLAFHLFSHRHLATPGALAPKLSGAASLTLWLTIVTFGRWIGFTL
ncbi:DUF6644 family protein [Sphingobium bisphenolivorans]|uniref:DUF6644 family protein n=1 Tax=Sphingobium bisphenolivorans TaxID=1335760 RepID=UPI0003A21B08|nr:DUF6644 family protein [Sphingobium bisphenolivorans]